MKKQKNESTNESIAFLVENTLAIANAMILSMIIGVAIVTIAK